MRANQTRAVPVPNLSCLPDDERPPTMIRIWAKVPSISPSVKVFALLILLTGLVTLLPLTGRMAILLGDDQPPMIMPRIEWDPAVPLPGQAMQITIQDAAALPNVLLTIDGEAIYPSKWESTEGSSAPWEWMWQAEAPLARDYELILYHHCDSGCIERARWAVGQGNRQRIVARPTKLGAVFANPERNWHGKSSWDVELAYTQLAGADHWGVDDLAHRVQRATAAGLRVILRVDYDQGQSLPPTGDQLALDGYLAFVRRLARDERLQSVYALQIGSGYNAISANSQSESNPVTPGWYARVFGGYGVDAARTDNIVQIVRSENPGLQVLVGPVQPWSQDQDGEIPYTVDAPWLNYFNTLVTYLDISARLKSTAGFPLAKPDGFAVQAPGRPDAPELHARQPATEPLVAMPRAAWNGAQAGFQVYRDWLAVINAHATTHNLPLFITSTNTFTPDDPVPPMKNYPFGWLRSALEEVNREPQVEALCWFLDFDSSGDNRWDWFSLSTRSGELIDAEREFDALLAERP